MAAYATLTAFDIGSDLDEEGSVRRLSMIYGENSSSADSGNDEVSDYLFPREGKVEIYSFEHRFCLEGSGLQGVLLHNGAATLRAAQSSSRDVRSPSVSAGLIRGVHSRASVVPSRFDDLKSRIGPSWALGHNHGC